MAAILGMILLVKWSVVPSVPTGRDDAAARMMRQLEEDRQKMEPAGAWLRQATEDWQKAQRAAPGEYRFAEPARSALGQ